MVKILLLLASLAYGQDGSVGTFSFLGENDTDSSVTLDPGEAQDALNVESNLQGTAILKRKGYTQEAALAIATSPVTGSHFFVDPSGNNTTIVCHDRQCAKSINGAAFSTFYSTGAASITRWQFVDINGTIYGTNDKNDQPLSYNGTTLRQPFINDWSATGSLIELTKDRMVISGSTATPNRVFYSQSGTYTNFVPGPLNSDPWYDDFGTPGDKITAIKYAIGRLYILKSKSITMCLLADQYSTSCYPVSNVIGTNDPASIIVAPDALYFRGQDLSYWRMDDNGLTLISKKISNLVKSQTSGSASSNIQTTQADWQAGSQSPTSSWNTSLTAGSVANSSTTLPLAGLQNSWILQNIDSNTVSGNYDEFTNNTTSLTWSQNNTNQDSSKWWVSSGGKFISTSTFDGIAWAYTTDARSTGTWSFDILPLSTNTLSILYAFFPCVADWANSGNVYPCSNGWQRLTITYGNSTGSIEYDDQGGATSQNSLPLADGNTHTIRMSKNTDKTITVYFDNTLEFMVLATTVPATGTQSFVLGTLGQDNRAPRIDNFFNARAHEMQYTQAYDTSFSTPTYAAFNFGVSSGTSYPYTFVVQSATSASGAWVTNFTPTTTGQRFNADGNRYFRVNMFSGAPSYASTWQVTTPTTVPNISFSQLQYGSTGQFYTQCIQPGSGITAWGLLSCNTTTAGSGSLVFYATSAVNCASLPATFPLTSPAWTAQTNNATMTISTNAAVYIGVRDLLGAATDQAQVNDCTVYWNNGTAAAPVWGLYEPIKNSLYWATGINNSSTNNRVLKYDLNLNQWYPFDLTATALKTINNSFYFGDSTAGKWYKYGASGVDSDNGSAINAYWKSKDFAGANPFQETTWLRSFVIPKNNASGSITATLTNSLANTDVYTISLATSSAQGYVRSGHAIKSQSPAPFTNIKLGNNAANSPFEIDGIRLDYTTKPWSLANP